MRISPECMWEEGRETYMLAQVIVALRGSRGRVVVKTRNQNPAFKDVARWNTHFVILTSAAPARPCQFPLPCNTISLRSFGWVSHVTPSRAVHTLSLLVGYWFCFVGWFLRLLGFWFRGVIVVLHEVWLAVCCWAAIECQPISPVCWGRGGEGGGRVDGI